MNAADDALLSFQEVSKSFGGVPVLRKVTFDVSAGEFIGLVGPNGAGKSTLIKILDGIYRPDSGRVLGATDADGSPTAGVVHQELALVDRLTVLENMRLGVPPIRTRLGVINRLKEQQAAKAALRAAGSKVRLSDTVGDLPPGVRTLIAVAKMLQQQKRVIVLDEATASLSRSESVEVLNVFKRHAPPDVAVIMVSHKLAEILDVATRVIVIIDGTQAADFRAPLPTIRELTTLLAPNARPTADDAAPSNVRSTEIRSDGEVLVEAVDAYTDKAGPVSLTLRAGEIVGLVGRMGAGAHDVALLMQGTHRPVKGYVRVAPNIVRVCVPPFRETQGVFPDLPVKWNMTMSALKRWRKWKIGLAVRAEETAATAMSAKMNVVARSTQVPIKTLSGGNQQKVLFGRALMTEPQLYVLCEPTRGIDVGTRHDLYEVIHELREEGAGVLVASSDPEDIVALCERVYFVDEGRIVRELDSQELTIERVAELI
jgi:ribose transport system ATP-binding protein